VRVLLARTGALGDVLLMRTALWWLRAGGHAVTLLAPARTARLLVGAHPALADVLLDADSPTVARLFGGELPPEWAEHLETCAAAVVYSRSAELAAALSTAISDVRRHAPQPAGMHAADWLCQPLAGLAKAPASAVPDLPGTPPSPVSGPSRDFVAIHPGSGAPDKNWPAERFAAVARGLEPDLTCVWVRGPAEAGLGPAPAGAKELAGEALHAVASELAAARLYLGNDSGLSHLAAAVGTPTLALFGPTDPALWAPRGRQVRVLRAPAGQLEALTVAAVLAAARELLAT
jgi:heptosyltransferase-2